MPHLEETAECPSCGCPAEPEEDATTRWWACACGYEFGHTMTSTGGDGCQLNIPAAARFAMGGVVPSSPGPHGDGVPVMLTNDCHIPVGPPR